MPPIPTPSRWYPVRRAILVKLRRKWKAMDRESAARMGDRVVAIIAAREMTRRMLDYR